MSGEGPDSDTRGIVDPSTMLRQVEFERHEAGDGLDGLVAWFWSASWSLPDGAEHRQQVLNHPAGHISIGTVDDSGVPLVPAVGRVYALLTGVSERRLVDDGWTVAARTTVGGMGAFLDGPVKGRADVQLALDVVPGMTASLVADVRAAPNLAARVDRLRRELNAVAEQRSPSLIAEARQVAEVAAHAEADRAIVRVDELAAVAGMSVRSLQRLFDVHVGDSPSSVIRRWRIIEAAESAKEAAAIGTEWRGWAEVAAELGYSDQAHLSRDFSRHLGVTPSAYVQRNRASGTSPR